MKKLVIVLLLLQAYLLYKLLFGEGSVQDVWELHQEVEFQRQQNVELRERNAALEGNANNPANVIADVTRPTPAPRLLQDLRSNKDTNKH